MLKTLDMAFVIMIISFPFNSLPINLKFLGELSSEGGFYASMLFILLCIFYYKELRFNKNLLYVYIILIFVVILSGIYNFSSIQNNYTKGQSGIEKFVGQLVLVAYFMTLSVFMNAYFALKGLKNSFITLGRGALIAFVLISLYSLAELFAKSNTFYYFDALIHEINYGVDRSRLRSISGEASWLVCYLIFLFPLAFKYLRRQNVYLCLFISLLFGVQIYLTQSKFSYPVIFLGIVMGLLGSIDVKLKYKSRSVLIFILSIPIIIYSSVLLVNQYERINKRITYGSNIDLSSLARIESQKAALSMGNRSPILGIGLGQYGFLMPQYISQTALKSQEIRRWISSSVSSPWAPAHGLLARIYGELGIFWLMIWVYIFCYVYLVYKRNISNNSDLFIILLMHVCVFLVGFNLDTFRYFPYWITLSLGYSLKEMSVVAKRNNY